MIKKYNGGIMVENCINKFAMIMKNAESKEYLFNLLTYSLAPTLLGLKCGTIVSLAKGNRGINKAWEKYSHEFLSCVKLSCYEINCLNDGYLLLFYDDKALSSFILKPECKQFLYSMGYRKRNNVIHYLNSLKSRFKCCIPHEMGLFLGIPLEDVEGFINSKGENYLYCGYWKVYSNLQHTMKLFNDYTMVKNKVIELLAEGMDSYEILKLLQ
jgi:hypothetical protein